MHLVEKCRRLCLTLPPKLPAWGRPELRLLLHNHGAQPEQLGGSPRPTELGSGRPPKVKGLPPSTSRQCIVMRFGILALEAETAGQGALGWAFGRNFLFSGGGGPAG